MVVVLSGNFLEQAQLNTVSSTHKEINRVGFEPMTLAKNSFALRKKEEGGGRKRIFRFFTLLQEPEHYRAVHYHSNGAVWPAFKTSYPSLFNKAQDGKLFC
jgi:hypothetical protein